MAHNCSQISPPPPPRSHLVTQVVGRREERQELKSGQSATNSQHLGSGAVLGTTVLRLKVSRLILCVRFVFFTSCLRHVMGHGRAYNVVMFCQVTGYLSCAHLGKSKSEILRHFSVKQRVETRVCVGKHMGEDLKRSWR